MRLAIDIIQDFVELDKLLHFLIAYMILTFVGGLTTWWIGLSLIQVLIFLKEFIDLKSYGLFSWKDVLAGEVGVSLGLFLLLMI